MTRMTDDFPIVPLRVRRRYWWDGFYFGFVVACAVVVGVPYLIAWVTP